MTEGKSEWNTSEGVVAWPYPYLYPWLSCSCCGWLVSMARVEMQRMSQAASNGLAEGQLLTCSRAHGLTCAAASNWHATHALAPSHLHSHRALATEFRSHLPNSSRRHAPHLNQCPNESNGTDRGSIPTRVAVYIFRGDTDP